MRSSLLLLSGLVWGCTGPSDTDSTIDPCLGGDDPSVVIGTGLSAYESTTDGQQLELIHGSQGGVHLTLAVDVTQLNAEETIEATLTGQIAGQDVGLSQPFIFLRCNPATDTLQAWGMRLIYAEDIVPLQGATTEVTIDLLDVDGRTATATTTYVIDDPEAL